jgi:hypothetical protein
VQWTDISKVASIDGHKMIELMQAAFGPHKARADTH